ncbi:long-chain-fatty-acid--CoA ligase [Erythrobacter sp. HA6-11]
MTAHHSFETFDEILNLWAKDRPDQAALEHEGRVTTFSELDTMTRKMIALFQSKGIGKGDRVAWLGKNSDLFFVILMAAARSGAVAAPVGWRLAPPEIAYILGDTEAKLVIAGEGFADAAKAIVADMGNGAVVLDEHETRTMIAQMDEADYKPAAKHTPALQLYTSGTTGNPKGAVLTNGNLLGLRRPGIAAQQPWYNYEADDCILACMPCAHIGGTGLVVISVSSGIRALILSEFIPDQVIDGIENGVTHMFIVPAAVQMVVQHPRAATTDFSNLRYLLYGAAPMPLELLKEAVRTMPGTGFLQVYGMTETAGTVTMLPPEDHDLAGNQRMRSCGKACPGVEIQIVDPDGNEVPRGTIGEIAILSPSNMAGYWKLPEATASTLDEDGWVHTGDAAYMDEDGYIYIQDRIKDMIISGGENVYPAEVESAIYGHPAIAEVAVIGIPSEKWGEEVKACVVLKPDCECAEQDVIEYARQRVAAFKAPKSIDFIPEMPRNPSGKILRRTLREPYWEGQERQVS